MLIHSHSGKAYVVTRKKIQRTLKQGGKQECVCSKAAAGKATWKTGVKQRAIKLQLNGSGRKQLHSE